MSIQSEIDRINENVANTYSVLAEEGADMPAEQNTDNLPSTAASIKAVRYDSQTLTDEQKAQARTNIGIVTVTVDNSWNTSMSAAEIVAAKNSGTIVILNCGILLAEVSASDNSDSPEYVDFSTLLSASDQLTKLTVRVTGNTAAPSFSNITADSIGLTPFSGSYKDLTDKPTIPSAYSHPSTHSASMISAGTFAGPVVANSNGQDPDTALIRNIQASSADLEAGVSELETGTIYIVFEE